jgi:hypothetical protein
VLWWDNGTLDTNTTTQANIAIFYLRQKGQFVSFKEGVTRGSNHRGEEGSGPFSSKGDHVNPVVARRKPQEAVDNKTTGRRQHIGVRGKKTKGTGFDGDVESFNIVSLIGGRRNANKKVKGGVSRFGNQ